ncbi:putative disease resistance RPP13-like protein 3 [Brachypodium distachyon]|uniref:putative disease resistance RPP13-like protein 3 n=1 Tax=Brachypodium distachyon TaxID=15368 RepID=UPI00052FF804|nr:putative disease resistance RPP13-like protein 3 [Brachypodium distachyon]|eukprot:XP_010239067.1 putative disease resistance RPP13-like protein 3 [Brachypodium distachyon]
MVKERVGLLKDDLEEIVAYLENLSEVEDPPLTARCWMKEVRELSYDIEDYMDKFITRPRKNVKSSKLVAETRHVKITPLPKRVNRHQKIVNTVSDFRVFVREAIERHERYDLDCRSLRRRCVSVGPMLQRAPFEEIFDVIIDDWRSEFISSLANNRDQQLKVVSLVGSGCLGKTTLARVFYKNFGGQYDCRAFVRVSQKPDMKRVFRDILWQLQRQQPPQDCKQLELIDSIRKHLQDKRYLLIIDDLWDASVWDIISHAFPKTCLLYFSMYPEGRTICKDDLVKQWVAEGFINAAEGQDMEKVAASYFDELVQRRFLQPLCMNHNNEVLSCTVHDMIHDFVAHKSAEENFITAADYRRKTMALSDNVHRLSLHFGDSKYAKMPANIRTSQVRSFKFSGLSKCMPSVAELTLIRVLNIELSGHHGDDRLDLTGISELFQLRYLKVASARGVCVELPNHMKGLQYLETLDMDAKVSAVPLDIIHLPCLFHLHLPIETSVQFDCIGSTGSISPGSPGSGKLINLRDIRLTCSVPPSDHLARSMEALSSLVGGHDKLKTLTIVPIGTCRNNFVRGGSASEVTTVSWDGLTPLLQLQRFEWLPCSCILSRVPKWIGEFVSLCILKISIEALSMNDVANLQELPALTAVSFYVRTRVAERVVFGKTGFSALKYFKFRCSVPWLKFETYAMPNLQILKLGFNGPTVDQHGTARINIERLTGLKEISVKIGGEGADAESALMDTVSNHPWNPKINIQLVDWVFYDDHGSDRGRDEDKYLDF